MQLHTRCSSTSTTTIEKDKIFAKWSHTQLVHKNVFYLLSILFRLHELNFITQVIGGNYWPQTKWLRIHLKLWTLLFIPSPPKKWNLKPKDPLWWNTSQMVTLQHTRIKWMMAQVDQQQIYILSFIYRPSPLLPSYPWEATTLKELGFNLKATNNPQLSLFYPV